MTTKAVADEYVSLFRQGKFGGAAMKRLFSADLVRVEPAEMGGPPVEMRGIEAVEENMRKFIDNNEIHGVEIDGPFVGDGRFAVRFAIDTTFKPTGERTTIMKMSLYTLDEAKIVREEVYYMNAPPRPED